MALNIKSERVHRLVNELASAMNESKTKAVEIAVQERLDRNARKLQIPREEYVGRLLLIAREMREASQEHPTARWAQKDWDNFLYDERGLPK